MLLEGWGLLRNSLRPAALIGGLEGKVIAQIIARWPMDGSLQATPSIPRFGTVRKLAVNGVACFPGLISSSALKPGSLVQWSKKQKRQKGINGIVIHGYFMHMSSSLYFGVVVYMALPPRTTPGLFNLVRSTYFVVPAQMWAVNFSGATRHLARASCRVVRQVSPTSAGRLRC